MKIKLITLPILTTLVLLSSVVPSRATNDFEVKLDRTEFLAKSGDSVTIEFENVESGVGFYVRQCESVGNDRPTNCNGMGSWVTDTSAPIQFPVVGTFGDTNCEIVACEIFVRRDHMNPDPLDHSLDRHMPIGFSALGVKVSKISDITDAGESLTVELIGLEQDKGVYVRHCAIKNSDGRPELCNGVQSQEPDSHIVWATLDSTWFAYGAVDAAQPFEIEVNGKFGSSGEEVDCQITQCGLFVRRDHLDGSDFTLDEFVPISFAKPTKKSQKVSGWIIRPMNFKSTVGQIKSLAKSSIKSDKGQKVQWRSLSKNVCSIQINNKRVQVVFKATGICKIQAKVKNSIRYKSVTYNWNYTVN